MPCTHPTFLVLLLLAGCRSRPTPGGAAATGQLNASWIGADTGKFSAPARGVWCGRDARLELTAVQGDAGIGLVLYGASPLRTGTYQAFSPNADSIPRPAASGAARWFTERALAAYQSDSGALELTGAHGALTGTFDFHMHSALGDDTMRLTGRFSGVVPGEACAGDSTADSAAAAPEPAPQ
jgi:hypothetical protein